MQINVKNDWHQILKFFKQGMGKYFKNHQVLEGYFSSNMGLQEDTYIIHLKDCIPLPSPWLRITARMRDSTNWSVLCR